MFFKYSFNQVKKLKLIVNLSVFFAFTAVILVTCALFSIKYKVVQDFKVLAQTESRIAQEQENIHVLKAELTFLSQPNNIQKIVDQYLNMSDTNKNTIYLKREDLMKHDLK